MDATNFSIAKPTPITAPPSFIAPFVESSRPVRNFLAPASSILNPIAIRNSLMMSDSVAMGVAVFGYAVAILFLDIERLVGEDDVLQVEGTIFKVPHGAHTGAHWSVEKILATRHGDELYEIPGVASSTFDGPSRRPDKKGRKCSISTAHTICSMVGMSISPNIDRPFTISFRGLPSVCTSTTAKHLWMT